MPEIRGIKRIICAFLILAMSGLMFTGCDITRELRTHYTKEEAEEEMKTGAKKMEEWIGVNCPKGKVISMENSFCQLTGGPIFLSGFVEGEFSDGRKTYGYLMNVKKGDLYLDPGKKMRQEFYDECSTLIKESLGVGELVMDKNGYSNMSFVLSMGAEDSIINNKVDKLGTKKDDALKEGAMNSWFSKEEKIMHLPVSLVLSAGNVRDYVRDKDRKDLILVTINAYVPEGTDLSRFTVKNIERIEKDHGIYFKRLILNTDKESMDLSQNGDERSVSLSKN